MTVARGAWGIPHVTGSTVLEVAFEQGRAVAEDRAWQLEHARLGAEGRTASVLGPSGIDGDQFARRVQLDRLGRRGYDALDRDSAEFVASFVAGVNEGLPQATAPELDELGIEPGEWQPWTPLSVFAAVHVLFGTFPNKLWRDHLVEVVGREVADALGSEGLWGSGSNAWAVGGSRTASGLPMVAGDPHRTFESPNPYQQVRLTCTDPDDPFDVVGFTFPGVPGVQHFAHAGSVAWGITNAMADYQDVYVERTDDRDGELWVDGVDGWERTERRAERIDVRGGPAEAVEVVETRNGHLFWSGSDGTAGSDGRFATGRGLSLRTAAGVLGDVGFDCLLPLLRARTAADVVAAFDAWVEPVNNLVVADVHGDVRQQVVGRVPARDDENRWVPVPGNVGRHRWQGWLEDLPGQRVGRDEHVVTANHRMNADFDRVGVEFAPPGRAHRIDALLADRDGLAPEDFAAVHRDTLAGQPAALAAAMGGLTDLSAAGAALQAEIASWDQHFDAESTTAAAYADVRDAFVERLVHGPFQVLAESLSGGNPYGPLFDYWFSLRLRVQLGLANLLSAKGRGLVPEIDTLLTAAVEEVAEGPRRPWAERHRFQPWHALGHTLGHTSAEAPGLAGDNDCVRCAGAFGTDVAVRGSVARYVWDLAGFEHSGWVVPLGASGDPSSPHHHDQTPLWVDGRLVGVKSG